MNALVEELRQKHPHVDGSNGLRISIHKVDVASADEIQEMFLQIDSEHGQRPDILISNAGYGKRIPQVWDISLEEFDYTINVNLRASFVLVKGVAEHMKTQRWGRIVFMSSIAAYGGGINGCRKFAIPLSLSLSLSGSSVFLEHWLQPPLKREGSIVLFDKESHTHCSSPDRLCGLQRWIG